MSKLSFAKLNESFWLEVLDGKRRGGAYSLLRGMLACAGMIYSAGLAAYLGLEKLGIRSRQVLPVPVISIGNISSGGTGKTPMTHWLVSRLVADGFRPVVLSRGHGGSISGKATQVSDDRGSVLHTASEVGDEPIALAHLLPGTPIYVGRDRRSSAAAALVKYAPDLIVLDDGLQYWQLARDLDVVLLDSRQPFDNGWLLPRGLLREPKKNLRRADILVVTRADLVSKRHLEQVIAAAQQLAPGAPIFRARYVFGGLRPLNLSAQTKLPERALAVCAIAQPDSFSSLLSSAGVALTEEMVALPDHAAFDDQAVKRIKGKIIDEGADGVIITEKDAVKFPAHCFESPVFAAGLTIEIDRPEEFYKEIMNCPRLLKPTK